MFPYEAAGYPVAICLRIGRLLWLLESGLNFFAAYSIYQRTLRIGIVHLSVPRELSQSR